MKTRRLFMLAMLFSIAGHLSLHAQTTIGRQKVDQYPTQSWGKPTYGLTWLPEDYTSTTGKYPLIIFLHGMGECGDGISGLNRLISTALPQKIAQGWNPNAANPEDGKNYKFIVVSPQAPAASKWSYGFGQVQWILADVVKRYRVDTSRIYITGLSAGGAGTWGTVTNGPVFAKKIAAVVPVAAAGTNTQAEASQLPQVGGTYGVKVWNVCGAADAWYSFAKNATNTINTASPAPGVPAHLTGMPGLGHATAVWNTAYDANWRKNDLKLNVYEWMLQYTRTSSSSSVAPAPVFAAAGGAQTITLPVNTVTLSGTGTATAPNTVKSYAWSKVSGPASATFTHASAATTAVTGLTAGTYVFRLTVTDNHTTTATSDVTITVNPAPNSLPSANAGTDIIITLPVTKTKLSGSGFDADGTLTAYAWTKVSGPSSFVIATPAASTTDVTALVAGTYLFEFKVTDNRGGTARDTVVVTVKKAPNKAPVVAAGADQTITLPLSTISLKGSATDADGTIAAYSWSKVSGPASFSFDAAGATATNVSGLAQGVYAFTLTATDNEGAAASDTVMVTVNKAPNLAPVVFAGSDAVLTLPADNTLLSGTGSDRDGTIASWQWTKASGPASFTFENSTAAATKVKGLTQGVYVFVLKGTDNEGAAHTDSVSVTVMAEVNQLPLVHAGTDLTITLPVSSVTLKGTASDKDGSITSVEWTLLSGSVHYSIANPKSLQTTVTNLVKGVYVFSLAATDNRGAVSRDTVRVTVNGTPSRCAGIRRYIVPGADGGRYLNGKTFTYNPGDTLVLKAQYTNWTYFSLENFHGTPECPIVVINEGGQVRMASGIAANHCSYLKLTGTGDPKSYYGFYVSDPKNKSGVGICIFGRSSFVEAERFDVSCKTYGAWIKNEASCDETMQYPGGAYIDNIRLHDSKFFNIGQDCIYAGSTAPNGGRFINCNGVNMDPMPMRLSNIRIYNLTIDSCNRTGIQLCGADSGTNEIHHNIITRCGFELNQQQGTGISIGGMSHAYVHDNVISQTFLYGIYAIGAGFTRIENNTIDSSGMLGNIVNTFSQPTNIAVDTKPTLPFRTSLIWVKNNKLGRNAVLKGDQVIFFKELLTFATGNVICGNTNFANAPAKIYVSPGIDWNSNCSSPVPPNFVPAVFAGRDQTIKLPVSTVKLKGGAVDQMGNIASVTWTKAAGPAAFTFSSASVFNPVVTGLVKGAYTFRLTVTDNQGAKTSDDVVINVLAANVAPVAHAGPDKEITLPVNTVTMGGTGTDADGSIVSYQWTRVGGPSAVAASPATASTTSLFSLIQGTYLYELKVTDNEGGIGRDTVKVTVHPAFISNVLPVANAGADVAVTLPVNGARLSGTATDADGTIASYAWTKISGPASGTIASSTAAATDVTALTEGVYAFELKVTDNRGGTAKDTVQVTVHPAPNKAPVAHAGSDQTIVLPVHAAQLAGTATDADGAIVSYSWRKVSGPASAILATPAAAATAVSGLTEGTYTFEFSVTDNKGAVARDSVLLTVLRAPNVAPVAFAGADQQITLPQDSVSLSGTATDGEGAIASYSWTKIGGPSGAHISTPASAATTVSALKEGTYVFELKVTDADGAVASDSVTITVLPAPNGAPEAFAGADQRIVLPANSVTLSGFGTDRDGTIAAYHWTKVGGPSSADIVHASAASTLVKGLAEGTYSFVLTVTDNKGAIAKDTVRVIVDKAPNRAPVAYAGTDLELTLPADSANLEGSASDQDGTIASYAWRKVSGPLPHLLADASAAATRISGLEEGVYLFELTVRDNEGAVARDTMQVTVQPAPNRAPVADAGSDISLTLPENTAVLSGSATDSDGTIASFSWNKISGPDAGSLRTRSSASAEVTSLSVGTYVFELVVTDNDGATARDTVRITVYKAPNKAPVAAAGADQTIVLPRDTVSLAGSATDPDGFIAAYRWSKAEGPHAYRFDNAASAATPVSGLTEGTYTFVLQATDDEGAVHADSVTVHVLAAPNMLPFINAGADLSITLPVSSVTLKGTASDKDGHITAVTWKPAGGEASFRIASPNTLETAVSGLAEGVYFFELEVTDNKGGRVTDTVSVTVYPAPPVINQKPTADAGADQSVQLPVNTAQLQGTGSDRDGSIASYRWKQLSGPSAATLVPQDAANALAGNLAEGDYTFELTVFDNQGALGKDTVTVRVLAAVPAPNTAPNVSAGADAAITLPRNSLVLEGSASDEDGQVVALKWTKISGPAATLQQPDSARTVAGNLVEGRYTFRFEATDEDGATTADTVQVTVLPAPVPNSAPVAKAGADQAIVQPASSVELKGNAVDTDGTIVSWQWTRIAGPSSTFIMNPAASATTVSGLNSGTYQFELKVTDDKGATGRDTVTVNVESGLSMSTATVYPNPARTTILVKIDAVTRANATAIRIYDAAGMLVHSEEFARDSKVVVKRIDVSALRSGAYYVQVNADINKVVTRKFVKQ